MAGEAYLKTGDESGHLCRECDLPMKIDKRGGNGWTIYCPCCGKELSSKMVSFAETAKAHV